MADFSNSNLDKVSFTDSNLFNSKFRNASLKGAMFIRSNMNYVNLKNANLTNAKFFDTTLEGALIDDAIFCNTLTPWGIDNSDC